MKITVVPNLGFITVDGRKLTFDFAAPDNLANLYWNKTMGRIEYLDGSPDKIITADDYETEVRPYLDMFMEESSRLYFKKLEQECCCGPVQSCCGHVSDSGSGQQGPKGDKGDPGPAGPQGPKGDKGDPGSTGQSQPHISFQEQFAGYYDETDDNRPVYCKAIYIDSFPAGGTNKSKLIPHGIENLRLFIEARGCARRPDTDRRFLLPFPHPSAALTVNMTGTDIELWTETNTFANATGTLIVFYTKD